MRSKTTIDAVRGAPDAGSGVLPSAVGPQAEFSFDGVSQYFLSKDNTPYLAVQDINLEIRKGRFVCIIGPSGCGKSTLLNMAAGLLHPTRGSAAYRGEQITEVNTEVGYITQQDHLLPWRTIERNVGLALEIRGVAKSERSRRVKDILELVGLTRFAGHYPSQLSGGMRKRAALARVLIYEPDTLLMDEPFGALDAQLRTVMQRELLELWEEHKKTVLFVTHDLEEAILMADDIIVFGKDPGRIIHTETVTLPRPRDLTTIRHQPEFMAIWNRLWSLIEGQLETPADAPTGSTK